MITLQKNYANGATRTITVTAVLATDTADTVILETAEDGHIVVCRSDDAALWQQLVLAGEVAA